MNLSAITPPSAEQVLCMLHSEYLAADVEQDRKAKLKILSIMARMSMQIYKIQQKKLKDEVEREVAIKTAESENKKTVAPSLVKTPITHSLPAGGRVEPVGVASSVSHAVLRNLGFDNEPKQMDLSEVGAVR